MKYVKSYCFFYKIWQKSMLKNSMLLVIGFCDSAVKRNITWSKVVRRQLKIFLIWIKLDQENSKLNMYIVYVIWFLAAVDCCRQLYLQLCFSPIIFVFHLIYICAAAQLSSSKHNAAFTSRSIHLIGASANSWRRLFKITVITKRSVVLHKCLPNSHSFCS